VYSYAEGTSTTPGATNPLLAGHPRPRDSAFACVGKVDRKPAPGTDLGASVLREEQQAVQSRCPRANQVDPAFGSSPTAGVVDMTPG
jgi:hypothetical protein